MRVLILLSSLLVYLSLECGLRFHPDSKRFKIVQFTDLHFGEGEDTLWGPQQDLNSTRVMETVLNAEHPDFVVFTGDCITGNNIIDNATSYWLEMLIPLIRGGYQWAVVFGNHDDLASGTNGTRLDLMNFDMTLPGSCSQIGPGDIDGVSNYVLTIEGSSNDTEFLLWFLDSNDQCMGIADLWGCIESSQVKWFHTTAQQHSNIPGFAFFHIPLQEYQMAWNTQTTSGWLNDSTVDCQTINTGLFAEVMEHAVEGVFVGHDHGNDFCGELFDVSLCYGRHSGYGGYGTWERGARVIELELDENGVVRWHSWIRFEDGRIESHGPIHKPSPPFLVNCN